MNVDAWQSATQGRPSLSVVRTGWLQVLAVGTTYFAGRLLASMAMNAAAGSSNAFDPAGETAGAMVVGLTLVVLAPMVAGTARSRMAAFGLVVVASVAAVMLEGAAFAPALSPLDRLPLGLLVQLGVAIGTAGVAVLAVPSPPAVLTPGPSSAGAVIRGVTGAAVVYVVAYFVAGAITYVLVTGPWYAAHAGGLVTPRFEVILVVAVIEGFLLSVGAVPLARGLTGTVRSRALACGLVLWALGGIVPLLQQASLPDVIRVASAAEIFVQKVPLGITVVALLAPAAKGGRQIIAEQP